MQVEMPVVSPQVIRLTGAKKKPAMEQASNRYEVGVT